MRETPLFSIAETERETGISRDTLRVWERRYGYPAPVRNPRGERLYTREHLERLRLLKQLLDRGLRPGKLIPLGLDELRSLAAHPAHREPVAAEVEELLEILAAGPRDALPLRMQDLLRRRGLQEFVTEVVAPANCAVGHAWSAGRIGIVEEHYWAEQVARLLNAELERLPRRDGGPRVLLTTFPGELHSLGLLMAACLIALAGGDPFTLGVQTPLEEIVRGARENGCHVVAISCSGYHGKRATTAQLHKLRRLLPRELALWAGGSGVCALGFLPGTVELFHDLGGIAEAVSAVRHRAEQRG